MGWEKLLVGGIVGGWKCWGGIVGREQLLGRNRGEESCRGGIVVEPSMPNTKGDE